MNSTTVRLELTIPPSPDVVLDSDFNKYDEPITSMATAFDYSGLHDHGELPSSRSEGHYSHVLSSLRRVRKQMDEVLTTQIGANLSQGMALDEVYEGAEEADDGKKTLPKKRKTKP